MEFGCRLNDRATIFRIGRTPDGHFRFFLSAGKILDNPQQFLGTSLVIETDSKAEDIINNSVGDGWEPHYVVVYGDVIRELEILGDMLNIPVCHY